MLQAADNLAFETRKVLFNRTFKPELRERVSLTRIKEKGDSILQVYKFDYTALKAFVDRQIKGRMPLAEMEPSIGASLWDFRNMFYEMGNTESANKFTKAQTFVFDQKPKKKY